MERVLSLNGNENFVKEYIKNNLMKSQLTLGKILQIDEMIVKEAKKELFNELFNTYGIYEIEKIANHLKLPYNKAFTEKIFECEANEIIEEKRDRVFEEQYIISNLQEKSSVLAKKLFLRLAEVREIKRNYLKKIMDMSPNLSSVEIAKSIDLNYKKFNKICVECKVKRRRVRGRVKNDLIDLVELRLKIQEGYSLAKLGKYFGCGDSRLKRILEQNNIKLLNQRRILHDEDKENIVVDYNNGISIPEIMEKYCTSEKRIKKILIGKCIFDKKNYELNDAEIQFLRENAPNMTLKELSMKLGRKGTTLRTILGNLKIKYKIRNCKGELWEWKGFNG